MDVPSSSSPLTSALQPRHTPILGLPNEILHQILSIVLEQPCHPTHHSPFDGYSKQAPTSTLLIPSVCHKLRAITNELPFWSDDKFDLLWLLPKFGAGDRIFLKHFFPTITQRLQQRTHWGFLDHQSLPLLLNGFHSFRQRATSVKLYLFVDDSFEYLVVPSSVDRWQVAAVSDHLKLDQLSVL